MSWATVLWFENDEKYFTQVSTASMSSELRTALKTLGVFPNFEISEGTVLSPPSKEQADKIVAGGDAMKAVITELNKVRATDGHSPMADNSEWTQVWDELRTVRT